MYSRFLHTAAAGLLMLSAFACGKQLPDGSAGASISFRSGVATKALLDTEGLKGETIVVNDMHVFADGTTMQYMSNVPLEYKDAGWTTTLPYYWTKGGLHRFAAYIEGQQVSYRQKDEALESEEITLSADNQPDLLYAFAVRDLDNSAEPHAPVVLDFSHALAAIRLTITNMKEDIGELKVSEYQMQNIVTRASFSVTAADADAVEYTMQPASDGYMANHVVTVPLNGSLALYADTGRVGTDGSLLVWPQEVDGGSSPVTLVLTAESGQIRIPLSTSSVSRWYAGRRYNYDINLSDDYIRVTATVQPWDIRDVIID